MKNIALRLRYDGSRYHGWQIQKNEISVAQTVEEALEKVLGTRTKVVGCGRTDAGVHALRYCANFHAETNIPMERMPLAVNSRLPDDIAVTDAVEVEENFNAIGSCIKKEYIYKIHNSNIRDPFLKDRVCFYPQRLDMEQFSRAAAAFEGTHDFKAVRSVGTETKTTVRTVYWCRAEKEGDIITVSIAPTASCTICAEPWSALWSTRPTASSALRISPRFLKRVTGASPGRPCRRRDYISTASGTTARRVK